MERCSVLKDVNVQYSTSSQGPVLMTQERRIDVTPLSFPVPDFFESFETLTIEKVLKRLNNFDSSFLQVDIVSGAEQISVKHLFNVDQQVIGRQIIFSLPGRLETPERDTLSDMAVASGWDSLSIIEQSFGFNSYSKFYLTRKFK